MPDVVMPRLSDSMEEGTVLRWLREEGDTVRRGEALVEIETDKATMTYEADADGVLEILTGVGDTLPIGEVIARIGEKSSAGARLRTPSATAPPVADEAAPAAQTPAAAGPPVAGEAAPVNGARIRASPLARRIARERGVELAGLSGSGPGGRVIRVDVEAAALADAPLADAPLADAPLADAPLADAPLADAPLADAPLADAPLAGRATAVPVTADAPAPAITTELADAPAPAEGAGGRGEATIQQLTRAQQVVARRMAESKATIPDFTLRTEVDMEGCVTLRAGLAQLRPAPEALPTYNDMIVRACALALREHPRANASYRDGHFELHGRVNVGIAVAAQDALVVPTVFDADRKSLSTIARETRGLAGRVRDGVITPPELSGGTFTVSNLGMYGVSSFTAVINPPQAAILSVGAVAARAVVRDGVLVARHTADLTLACDHRILYGADAARFLQRVGELLTAPLALAC